MSTAPEIKQEFQPVLCDMCLDKPMPALKTCLKCEISMCAQHLQAHLTTPVLLQTHPLTKPITPGGLSSGAVRCPEHGKLLEYYCLDDRTCVCVSCSIEDRHRLHNMKTLPSAHKVLVEKLREELKELPEREIQGEALKSWETEKRKALSVSSECLVKGVSALRDIGLTKVQSSVSARLGAIQAARQNIEAALSEEDAHLFLQRFAGVHEAVEKARAVDFIHGLEEEAEPGEVVAELLKNGHQAMEKVRKLQRHLLVLVDPDNQYWGRGNPTNVMFDHQTTGRGCVVSSDFKMLFCQPHIQDISQRVYFQNSTDDDLYWTIQFSEKYDWSVGICAQNLPSKAPAGNTLHGPLYGLEWKNKKLSALYTSTDAHNPFSLVCKVIECPPKPRSTPQSVDFPNKLEVQWDCSSQSLSFFSRGEYDELICLHSLDIDSSSLAHKLRPFVTLEKRQDPASNNSSMSSGSMCMPFGQSRGSSPCMDFVCALNEKIGSGPPTKKRKVI